MDFSALGREGISAGRPSGDDVRYHPLFDQLQAEVDKSSLPSLAGSVEWEKVASYAAEILSCHSKDLLVASYLAVGLMQSRGVEGLAVALNVYADLLQYHGAALFPQRMRGRVRAVEWWLEKCDVHLPELNAAVTAAQLAELEEGLSRLERLMVEHVPEATPLRPLREFLERAAVPDQSDQSDRSDRSDRDAEAEPLVLNPPATDPIADVLPRLREAAAALRRGNPAAPLAYRLSRQAAWLSVTTLPPAEGAKTRLAPPPSAASSRLADLGKSADLACYLDAIESLLDQHIFWLDLNRLAAEALAGLGASDAATVVAQESSFLLQRLPGVEALAFFDGTPFADPATRQWLGNDVAPAPSPVAPVALLGAEVDSITQQTQQSVSLIAEGKLIEAIEGLQRQLECCSSQRDRLQWRVALSQVLVETGRTRLALPHLEQAVRDIQRYRLETYEPELALSVLKLAWRGFSMLEDPPFPEQAREVLHRIARLDATEMIRLAKEGERS
ncbi:type VI secretion system protein TssA [Geomesophilobacter sediminis]|uniref:Type VI secretion system protein TssA n=1 Tax=Geomesophilobacter sediminis TaxID=2798584 RepID=A0A8J7JJ48_9BACT|nr:type VI secretion system protein TssA [Geomesophilobacter sediminis]MBJ6724530.1 type VI secretion system protein TssA [Geomesophilobacter sediminis]